MEYSNVKIYFFVKLVLVHFNTERYVTNWIIFYVIYIINSTHLVTKLIREKWREAFETLEKELMVWRIRRLPTSPIFISISSKV